MKFRPNRPQSRGSSAAQIAIYDARDVAGTDRILGGRRSAAAPAHPPQPGMHGACRIPTVLRRRTAAWLQAVNWCELGNRFGDLSRREGMVLAGAALSALGMASGVTDLSAPSAAAVTSLVEGDRLVRSLWLGRLAYPVLIASLEAGVFEALEGGALTLAELGRRTTPALPPRPLQALTATCAALGLLRVSDGGSRISLDPSVAPLLTRRSPYYWGGQLLAADGTHASLRRALARSSRDDDANAASHGGGGAQVDYSKHSLDALGGFIDSMEAHSAVTAAAAAVALDLTHYTHLLDMGGGSGVFARALCDANPQLTATIGEVRRVSASLCSVIYTLVSRYVHRAIC